MTLSQYTSMTLYTIVCIVSTPIPACTVYCTQWTQFIHTMYMHHINYKRLPLSVNGTAYSRQSASWSPSWHRTPKQ